MANLDYNIGQIPFADKKWSCGIAYVAIVRDVDRDKFITDCVLSGRISIRTEDGGIYHRCPVSKNIFNDIKWPEKWQDNGTPVVYVTDEKFQQPLVLGSLNFSDEIVDIKENGFKISREHRNNLVQLVGNTDSLGELLIFVEGVDESKLSIKITNDSNKGLVDIDVDGGFELKTINNINNTSQSGIVNKVGVQDDESSTVSQTSTEFNARVSRFSINDGSEAIMLGNLWKDFMDAFIDEISRSTVTTSIGQMPLLNATQIANFRQKTEEILSKYSFTD